MPMLQRLTAQHWRRSLLQEPIPHTHVSYRWHTTQAATIVYEWTLRSMLPPTYTASRKKIASGGAQRLDWIQNWKYICVHNICSSFLCCKFSATDSTDFTSFVKAISLRIERMHISRKVCLSGSVAYNTLCNVCLDSKYHNVTGQ